HQSVELKFRQHIHYCEHLIVHGMPLLLSNYHVCAPLEHPKLNHPGLGHHVS
ncbi:hypothetical protein DOY81_003648, partial [Sarcophaga bullata]